MERWIESRSVLVAAVDEATCHKDIQISVSQQRKSAIAQTDGFFLVLFKKGIHDLDGKRDSAIDIVACDIGAPIDQVEMFKEKLCESLQVICKIALAAAFADLFEDLFDASIAPPEIIGGVQEFFSQFESFGEMHLFAFGALGFSGVLPTCFGVPQSKGAGTQFDHRNFGQFTRRDQSAQTSDIFLGLLIELKGQGDGLNDDGGGGYHLRFGESLDLREVLLESSAGVFVGGRVFGKVDGCRG